MTDRPQQDEQPIKTRSQKELAERRWAYDDAERKEVIGNLRKFGDYAHPDDPPGRSLYLQQRYAGTGLSKFLDRIEGKPTRQFQNLK